jgi:hypothetical protein
MSAEGQQEVRSVCAASGCRKKPKGKSKYCGDTCKKKASRSKTKKAKSKSKLTCLNCPNSISYGNKSGLCKPCKDLERIAYRKANLYLCSISKWLIRKVIRHGTVECLPRDKQGMLEILSLRISYYQANGFTFNDDDWNINLDARRFEICHRFPCKHTDGRIGLFVRDNLVIAPKSLNRSMGNRVVCENGLYLDPANLDPAYLTEDLSDAEVFDLIAEWCPYIVEHLMQKTDKGAYRFSLVRSRSKPKKKPKNIEGLLDRAVWRQESYQSFGFEDMTPFQRKVNYTDLELDFNMSYLDLGFEYLLTTPALPRAARKANTKTPSDFEYAPMIPTTDEFEDLLPF